MRDKEVRGQSFVKSRLFVSLSRNYSRIHRKLEGFSARRAYSFSSSRVSIPHPRMLMNTNVIDEQKVSCILFCFFFFRDCVEPRIMIEEVKASFPRRLVCFAARN